MPDSFRAVGTRGSYEWLVSDHTLDQLLEACPQLITGKFLAVTSMDSGIFMPTPQELEAGWTNVDGIAYSSAIHDPLAVARAGWDEWYVFDKPRRLGALAHGYNNIFTQTIAEGRVYPFVNFGGDAPSDAAFDNLFWPQIEWIQPESYLAEGVQLSIVSSNRGLFAAARRALEAIDVHS